MAVDMLNTVTKVNYPLLMDFEKNFDAEPYRIWMENNWTVSIFAAVVYVLAIFSIQKYMESKQRFDLHVLLGLWSAGLAVFSFLGTLRTIQETYEALKQHGFLYSVCNPGIYKGPSGFWVMLYAFSKLYELGDTLFIVLRKQKLIFLHWYHHLVTLIYMFFSYKDFVAYGRWGIMLNFTVHSFMYTYYALKAFKVKVPRTVNQFITSIQIVQMVIGVSMTSYAFVLLDKGEPCQLTYPNNIMSTLMYLSYLLLFVHFFYQTYLNKQKKRF